MSEVKRTMVAELLRSGRVDTEVVVKGWVRTKRGNKNVAFIALNDGSSDGEQYPGGRRAGAAFDGETDAVGSPPAPASVSTRRLLVEVARFAGQRVEVQAAASSRCTATADPATRIRLQKKGHTLEFLRDIALPASAYQYLRCGAAHPPRDGLCHPQIL